MEFNGLCNLTWKIRRLVEHSKLKQEDAESLFADIKLFEKYLLAYHLDPKIYWHEVRANQSKYQTLGEYQETEIAKIKAEKSAAINADRRNADEIPRND